MQLTSRSPLFWISIVFGFICSIGITRHYFSKAIPLVNLTVSMDRATALQKAAEISNAKNIGPKAYRAATDFTSNNTVKTYIELEAGGKDMLAKLMSNEWYQLYIWRVRHFNEFDFHESTIFFTPDGRPYGFFEIVSENEPGAALSADEAREIAENTALHDWNVDLTNHMLVETKKEVRISDRIDYEFIYERTDRILKDAPYRLIISVSGDKCTGVEESIKIPKDFIRRYNEMRSKNQNIAWIAHLLMSLLYLFCCGIIGFIFLIKQRLAWIRPAILCGVCIAFLNTLVQINSLPLLWMNYNTARSMTGFIIDLISKLMYGFIYNSILFSFICLMAEGLTRYAFGNHIQLWKCTARNAASSLSIIGRVFGGYLVIGFDLAILIVFYIFTTRYLGWWMPSDSLIDPNVLATYAPWFSSIAISIQAGFIEECLFRAIPLASAAIIGRRLGKEKLCIGIAFILQAIVFGAAHATYASQPAYSRLIELIIPSFIFGALYLWYGLIPSIIAHTVYDIFWIGLPLFVSSAPNAWIHQTIIIIISATPIWIVIYRLIQEKKYHLAIPTSLLNKEWIPRAQIHFFTQKIKPTVNELIPHKTTIGSICLSSILIAIGMIIVPKTQDAPWNVISRTDAIAHAQKIISEQSEIDLSQWTPLSSFNSSYTKSKKEQIEHRFAWQVLGKETYRSLMAQGYILPPHWIIRLVRFTGSTTEREEEYTVTLSGSGKRINFFHWTPESTPGASLTEQEARDLAHTTLKEQYDLDPATTTEILARAHKEVKRTDWTFIFNNSKEYPLKAGQARIKIHISGDKLGSFSTYMHVPQDWKRNETDRLSGENSFYYLFSIIALLMLIMLFLWTIKEYTFPHIHPSYIVSLIALTVIIRIGGAINAWPTNIFNFNTAQPYTDQFFRLLTSLVLSTISSTFLTSIFLGYISSIYQSRSINTLRSLLLTGLTTGISIGIVPLLLPLLFTNKHAFWKVPDIYNRYLPIYTALITTIIHLISISIILLIGSLIAHRWYNKKRSSLYCITCTIPLFVLITLLYQAYMQPTDISEWLTEGVITGTMVALAYHCVIRYDHAIIIPLATGIIIPTILLTICVNGNSTVYMIALITTVICSILLTKLYRKNS